VTPAHLADTHAHLMDPRFADDFGLVVERARVAGVVGLVCVGYDVATSRAAIALARQLPGAAATVGIHPNSVGDASDTDFDAIAELAREPEVAAIGETGLDYYRDRTPHARQREAFAWHLRLAEERQLPVVVHNRAADADVATLLERSAARRQREPARPPVPGVLHCFSSTDAAYLEAMLRAGYYVSFAGILTFPANGSLRALAARVPSDRLLVETDCPYLAPQPHRGRRNEPAFVRATASCLAELRGAALATLAADLWANSRAVFPALAAAGIGFIGFDSRTAPRQELVNL